MQNPSKPDWDELARRPGFQALIDAKKRFIVPCCIFFLLYYSALLYLVGWHPELMKKVERAADFASAAAFMVARTPANMVARRV